MSWDDCVATLARAGPFLRLPTEAQWEYGCRARTTTPWWTDGYEPWVSLVGVANVTSLRQDQTHEGELQAIGGLRCNPFGLHVVYGNVWEWCSDEFGAESVAVRSGDGERVATGSRRRVYRGGGFIGGPGQANSSMRVSDFSDSSSGDIGLRLARPVTP